MAFNEKAWHVGFKWTIGDEDNPTGAICLDDSSDALHICEIADARTDWNVSSLSHPTLYVHSATTPETDYIAMYHDGDYAYLTVDGTTLLTMTTTTLDISVATTIAGDLDITTDDIAVSQGYYMYFDGLGNATEYIRSDAADKMAMAATTEIDLMIGSTDEVAITSTAVTLATNNLVLSAGNLTVGGTLAVTSTSTFTGNATLNGSYNVVENVTYFKGTASNTGASMQTDKMLCFRTDNERIYLRSTAVDKLKIYCAGATADSITIQAGSAGTGSIVLQGYLIPWKTDTDGSTEGQLWFDDSENRFKYYDGSSVLDLVSSTYSKTLILTGYLSKTGEALVMGTTTLLGFRNDLGYPDGAYINSPAADKLTIHAPSQADDAIRIQTKGATGGITIGGHLIMDGFLKVYRTNSVSAVEGDIWYNNNTNTLRYFDGVAEKTIATV